MPNFGIFHISFGKNLNATTINKSASYVFNIFKKLSFLKSSVCNIFILFNDEYFLTALKLIFIPLPDFLSLLVTTHNNLCFDLYIESKLSTAKSGVPKKIILRLLIITYNFFNKSNPIIYT